jgi:HK97 gp10 family phage protein
MAKRFKGADAHLKHMRNMTLGMRKEAQKLIYTLADMHATEAAISITTGAVSGKGHVPSRPGEPPNADTHVLDRSIHVEQTGPLTAKVVADAPYAIPLEFGDERMAERPFMRPAATKVKKAVDKLAKAGVRRINRGGKL